MKDLRTSHGRVQQQYVRVLVGLASCTTGVLHADDHVQESTIQMKWLA